MKVTMIKPDAVVKVEIGSGFLQKLQMVVLDLFDSKTEEEVQGLKEAIENHRNNDEDFPEQWMENIYVMTTLISEIEKAIIKEGFTYEKDIDEFTEETN
jgi:hypothetical protein